MSGLEGIIKKPLENNANIKVSTFNDNNIVNINCNKGKDTDIDLLISKNLSDMNGNSRENRAANESECKKVDEINLIDFSEPEINSVDNSDKDCNVFSEIGELTAIYRNRESLYK